MTGVILLTLIVLIALGFSFLITTGIFWLICLCFSLVFSWKIALGVWLVLLILGGIFKTTVTVGKD